MVYEIDLAEIAKTSVPKAKGMFRIALVGGDPRIVSDDGFTKNQINIIASCVEKGVDTRAIADPGINEDKMKVIISAITEASNVSEDLIAIGFPRRCVNMSMFTLQQLLSQLVKVQK